MAKLGAGERTQQLRELSAFPGDLDLIPSTHMSPFNHLSLQFQGI